jgi:concanavalin A-like lectin/glucanase superfamily protein
MTDGISRRALLQALSAGTLGVAAGSVLGLPKATAAPAPGAGRPVPKLDDLAGEWQAAPTLLNPPSVNNFVGSLHTTANLLSCGELTFPPLSLGGEAARLLLDGVPVQAHESRWFPYQAVRRAAVGALALESTVRMAFEQPLVLFELDVANAARTPVTARLDVDLGGYLRAYPGPWEWGIPRQYGTFTDWRGELADSGRVLSVVDATSGAASAFSFPDRPDQLTATGRATWTIALRPDESRTVRIVLAAASTPAAAVSAAVDARARFTALFQQAKQGWERRFADAFTPDNEHFSGSLPVLATDDDRVRDLYYRGVLSVLALERTDYAQFLPRTYVTAGPQWGVTLAYFWDTSLFAPLLVLLDPVVAREQARRWLERGVGNGYAVDALSSTLVGPWYSANDLSAFTMLLTYMTYTGDVALLDEPIGGQLVIDQMQALAQHWQQLVVPATGLADYGVKGNLLEEVPRYVNQVPSLNAANVWMLRQVADLRTRRGEDDVAAQLRAEADDLAARVLALYVPGQGVWQTVHDDGSRVTVRHVYDFDTIGRLLSDDLTPAMRAEMTAFVTGELIDGGWMRALSLSDPDAANSLRPDHGSNGAYDAWPALAAGALARFGDYASALGLLRSLAGVGAEGPFAQSHELVPEPRGVAVWDRPELNPTGAITVAAWIRPDAWPAQVSAGSIVSKLTTTGAWYPLTAPNAGYALRGGGAGVIAFSVVVAGKLKTATTKVTVPTGGWHHVAGTFDGQQVAVCIDGVLAATTTARGTFSPADGPNLLVGADPIDPTSKFTGAVDEVRVYGRALAVAEIAALCADPTAGADDPALALHLPLDEGRGDTTVDAVSGAVESVIAGHWGPGREGSALSFARSAALTPRISRQQYNENNGGAFPSTILQDLFGYAPDGERAALRDPATPRGVDATLRGITFAGRRYSLVSDPSGVRLIAE